MEHTEFWNGKHQVQNRQWLTGTSLSMIYRLYDITSEDLRSKKILEIGVGIGIITKSLRELASELYCADISDVALKNIGKHANDTFLTQDIDQAPAVDVVICHLVLVHCDDNETQRILSSVNLSTGGKIYCQFSCLKTPDAIATASPKVQKELTEAGPHYFRTPNDIEKLLAKSGLQISRAKEIDPGTFLSWSGQTWKLYELERNQS